MTNAERLLIDRIDEAGIMDAADVVELLSDAARWRYVRDNLAYPIESMVGGTHAWTFRSPFPKCATITEVIDKLIAAERTQEVQDAPDQ